MPYTISANTLALSYTVMCEMVANLTIITFALLIHFDDDESYIDDLHIRDYY